MFSFSLPAAATAATAASASLPPSDTATSASASSSASSVGGLFSGATKSGNVLSFGGVAASTEKSSDQSIFTTKDTKAFQSKPLFAKAGEHAQPSADSSSKGDTSKDEVEDYEPQVDFKPVIPMPDLVDVKTGEEEEEKLLCERAKLFRFDGATKEWKERGVGEVKLLKNNSTNKVRLLMRRDQTHKVCANHLVTADMSLTAMANSDKAWVWAANDYADEDVKVEKFAIRFKTSEPATKFKCVFEEAQKLVPIATAKDEDAARITPAPATASAASVSAEPKPLQSLSEMFKPAAGSWECSMCLVVNKGDAGACVSCATPKEGAAAASEADPKSSSSSFSSGFGGTPFPFKSAQPSGAAFTFGAPSSSSSSAVPSSAAPGPASSTFSFGFSGAGAATATVMPLKATISAADATPSSASLQQPFSFTWKAGQNDGAQATPTPSNTASGSISATTPVKQDKGFSFGSPGKYQFSFSGVRSPRSRDTSTCESENGVEEEEEEDNLYFEPVVPLPDKVDVVTGEESELERYCHRAKLYRLKDGEYKDRGIGDVKILEHKQTGRIRLLMRREAVHKVCLNHYLTADMAFRPKDEKALCWVATDHSEDVPARETFAIRFKTTEIVDAFSAALSEAQAKLGSSTTIKASTAAPESLPSILEEDGSKAKDLTDVAVVYEKKATPEQVRRARKLFLPDNFYLYEQRDACPGCIGCSPDELVFKKLSNSTKEDVDAARKNLFGDLSKASATPSASTPTLSFGSPAVAQSGSASDSMPRPFVSVFGGPVSFGSPRNIFADNSPAPSATIFGGAKQTTSIFGGDTTPATSANTKSDIFGSPAAGSPSLFGGKSSGTPSIFGNQTTGSTSIFGGQTAGSPSIFGNKAAVSAPVFDSQSGGSTSIFGGSQPASSAPIFGGSQPTSSAPIFGGEPSKATSVFDVKPTGSLFSAAPSVSPPFGAPSVSPSFGAPSVSPAFGAPSVSPAFGAPSSQPSTVFDGFKLPSTTSEKDDSAAEQTICGKLEKGALSFGDLAQNSNSLPFDQQNSNSWAWVSKPLFGGGGAAGAKSPDKDESAEAADEDYDPHYEPVIPMPDLVKVTTGEEGWTDLFSSRAKVYRFDAVLKEWKERGIGEFKIQHEPLINKYRLLQRREQVHKLSCNQYLTPSLTLDPMMSSEVAWCWLAMDFSENPAGEHMKLAVKFKNKEISTDFKAKLEACQRAMSSSPPPLAPSAEDCGDVVSFSTVTTSAVVTLPATSPQQHDDAYDDVTGSDDDSDGASDEDDDDEQTVIFSKEAKMFIMSDKGWQALGEGALSIKYDDDAYGARITGVSAADGARLLDNLISIQTNLYSDAEERSVNWLSLDELQQAPRKVHLKAVFETQGAVDGFVAAFEEGKEYAYNSGIEDTCRKDVPEDLLYYGQGSSED